MKNNGARISIVLSLLASFSAAAISQERRDHQQQRNDHPRETPRLDQRSRNDRGFPPLGHTAGALPRGRIPIAHGGGRYFFNGGVWFRPIGGSYLVIAPPIGIFAPVLPPSFVTLQIDGTSYYYANGIYYAMRPEGGYSVVAPPSGRVATPSALVEPMTSAFPALVIEPRNAQSYAQTEADQQACNSLAATHPGAENDSGIYLRAFVACMDVRGYTVR